MATPFRVIATLVPLLLAGATALAIPPVESGAVTITDAMIQDATFPFDANEAIFPFDANEATFPLNGEDATIPPSTTVVKGNTKTVRLVSDIFFAFDSAELNPAAIAKLPGIIEAIPKGKKVEVNGHTDSIGSDSYNLTLSQNRSKAVATALAVARPDLKITTHGYGKANPVAPNTNSDGSDNPSGRAQNRRVDIVYQIGSG